MAKDVILSLFLLIANCIYLVYIFLFQIKTEYILIDIRNIREPTISISLKCIKNILNVIGEQFGTFENILEHYRIVKNRVPL